MRQQVPVSIDCVLMLVSSARCLLFVSVNVGHRLYFASMVLHVTMCLLFWAHIDTIPTDLLAPMLPKVRAHSDNINHNSFQIVTWHYVIPTS
jgi:hypothetical protein